MRNLDKRAKTGMNLHAHCERYEISELDDRSISAAMTLFRSIYTPALKYFVII